MLMHACIIFLSLLRTFPCLPVHSNENPVKGEECTIICYRIFLTELNSTAAAHWTIESGTTLQSALLEKNAERNQVADVCWALIRFLHCAAHCSPSIDLMYWRTTLNSTCSSLYFDLEASITCFDKHHTTAETFCNVFKSEAIDHRYSKDEQCQAAKNYGNCVSATLEFQCGSLVELITDEQEILKYFLTYQRDEMAHNMNAVQVRCGIIQLNPYQQMSQPQHIGTEQEMIGATQIMERSSYSFKDYKMSFYFISFAGIVVLLALCLQFTVFGFLKVLMWLIEN